ncbi:very short patch repair endonuclease [Diaminobutyricimonas sp. TR449]|uniref:very short patch repair endonuclease n=1 Tax=Diaminobutyricimonas sp. TR449 TaxID=2708076 RepID=UPI00141E18E6|nr:very short patch repair endonuclease [Diaminobutyricimonas sp. TR449]
MADVLRPEQRRHNMSRIRSRDTKPELILRSMLHARGYRYRLHAKNLPGTPDLVFTRKRKAIFVNGCFWHLHSCQYGQVRPKTNAAFWETKRQETAARDARKTASLEEAGWQVLTVWECELRHPNAALGQVLEFLESPNAGTA